MIDKKSMYKRIMKNKNAAKRSIYKKIKATLSQGTIFHKIYIFVYIWIALCSTCFFVICIMAIIDFESIFESIDNLFPGLFFLLVPAIMSCLMLIKPYKLRKEIYLYLDDAVPLYAKIKEVGRSSASWFTTVKIRVEFSYKKEKHVKYSEYSAAFLKYANKTVDILYSPKYDEILFLE